MATAADASWQFTFLIGEAGLGLLQNKKYIKYF
jgi:hypothetical protein